MTPTPEHIKTLADAFGAAQQQAIYEQAIWKLATDDKGSFMRSVMATGASAAEAERQANDMAKAHLDQVNAAAEHAERAAKKLKDAVDELAAANFRKSREGTREREQHQ